MSEKSSETEKLESEGISVTIDRKPNCLVQLEISLSPSFLQKMHIKALKQFRKNISLPGFRKGRVPDNLLQQKYDQEIEKEFRDLATGEALNDAVKLTGLHPFNRKERVRVNIDSLEKDKGGKFTAEFEIYPQIPEINASEIEINRIVPEPVSEELIDQNVDFFRLRNAQLQEVSGRSIQEGDVLDLEIMRMDREDASKHPRIILSKNKTEKWIYDNVIGLEKGKTVENIKPELPKGSAKEAYEVKINVLNVLEGQIPEADDEHAKKVGYETNAELRKKIKEEIEDVIKEEVRKAHCVQIEHALINKYAFDIPMSLKNHEINNRLKEKKESLAPSEKDDVIKLKSLENEAVQEAEEAIRLQFIFSNILGKQNINVSEVEIAEQMSSYLKRNPGHIPKKDQMQQFISYLREQALVQKLFDYLLDHVDIKEKKP